MKKRVLSLLLVVAMLATLVVFPAYASDTDLCPCGCGETLGNIEWKTWKGTSDPASGHYRLESDLLADKHINIGNSKNLEANIVLDLNGHVWRSAESYLVGIGTNANSSITMDIFDSVGGGEMQAYGANGSAGVVMLQSGDTLNLHGGTIRQLYSAGITTTIGALYVMNATVNMTGGKITDGYTTSAASGGTHAGNVLLRGTETVMNMSGGEIVNGHASTHGGGVVVFGTLNMTGGKIYNNVTDGEGGNIYVAGSGTATFDKNAEVVGGVANFGGNIYNAGATTLDSVTGKIDGDIYTSNSSLALVGTVNIPMGNSNGIVIAKDQVLDLTDMNTDSVVFFGVNWGTDAGTYGVSSVFTAEGADKYLNCFKQVGRTVSVAVTEGSTTLEAATRANVYDETASYCPHCGENAEPVAWTRLSNGAASSKNGYTHFFTNGNYATTWGTAGTVVVDMHGTTNTKAALMHKINVSGVNFSILDTVGGGVTASSLSGTASANRGGVLSSNNDGYKTTFTVYSGTLQHTGSAIAAGGVIAIRLGELNIKGGIIKDGEATNGGNIWTHTTTNGVDVNISGGLISNGTAGAAGGGSNIQVGTTSRLNMTGGIVEGGNGGYYGSLTINSTGVNSISNALIRGGSNTHTTYGYGANVAMINTGKLTMNNVTVAGGTATVNGGNIKVEKASGFDMTDCLVYDGSTPGDGGNIYIRSNVTDDAVTLTDCRIYNGKAEVGTEQTNVRADNLFVAKDIVLDNVQIYGNSGLNDLGSGLYALNTGANITVTLKNNTIVGEADEALNGSLYLNAYTNNAGTADDTSDDITYNSSLVVDESFSGLAVLSLYQLIEAGYRENPYGQILLNASYNGEFTGKLYLGDHKTGSFAIWEVGMPEIYQAADGQLQVAAGLLENAKGKTFYQTAQDAVDAYKAGDVVKLLADADTLTLAGGEYYIDVNGKMPTVSATAAAKVYGLDSANANGENAGDLTIVGENVTVAKAATSPVDGEQYVNVQVDDLASFHNIKMDITKVTLRTSSAGIFYKGQWTCDADLEQYIKDNGLEYGVVVSLTDMPGADFVTENTADATPNLYSVWGGAGFVSGAEQTGVAVSNILLATLNPDNERTVDENAEYAQKKIYARAYLNLGDGEYIVDGEGAELSMMDVLKKIDEALVADPNFTTEGNSAAAELMATFYNNFKNEGLADAITAYGYEFQAICKEA